jgi:hypothetical protein
MIKKQATNGIQPKRTKKALTFILNVTKVTDKNRGFSRVRVGKLHSRGMILTTHITQIARRHRNVSEPKTFGLVDAPSLSEFSHVAEGPEGSQFFRIARVPIQPGKFAAGMAAG